MKSRIEAVQSRLQSAGCDAFLSFAPPTNQYLTGFRGTTSCVIITPAEALFLCDFRYTEQAGEMVKECVIQEVAGSMQVRAGERLTSMGVKRVAFEPSYMTVGELDLVRTAYSGEVQPVADIVSAIRMVKSSDEVEAIEAAGRLAEGVLDDVLDDLRVGITERELAAEFEYAFKARGASGASFDTIVLFGSRTSLPHGQPGDRALKEGDIVLMDFGCRLNGYCSDLTRTYAFGTISPWFEEIYQLTLTAQRGALNALRAGKTGREVDSIAREIIAEAGHGKHFGHGLGHGVGIEIHEPPRLNPESNVTLAPGMVVTVEPGIYVPGQGGVRIEDLVVVTEEGCRNLSRASKELRVLNA